MKTALNTDEIARRAYSIYEQEGRQEGKADEHWLRAEAEILGQNGGNGKSANNGSIGTAAASEFSQNGSAAIQNRGETNSKVETGKNKSGGKRSSRPEQAASRN